MITIKKRKTTNTNNQILHHSQKNTKNNGTILGKAIFYQARAIQEHQRGWPSIGLRGV